MARVANGNLRRLKQAKAIFEIEAKNIKPDIFEFIEIAIKFYKAYGMWSLTLYKEKMVDKEAYSGKEYVKATVEMRSLAEGTLDVCIEIKKT